MQIHHLAEPERRRLRQLRSRALSAWALWFILAFASGWIWHYGAGPGYATVTIFCAGYWLSIAFDRFDAFFSALHCLSALPAERQ